MRPVAPRVPGCEEHTFGEDQGEYMTVTVAIRPSPCGGHEQLTRWRLTTEERARIAMGEDLYVVQLAAEAMRMTPLYVTLAEPEGGTDGVA